MAALEAADAPPTDEEGFAAGRGHRRQVDFAQIDGSLSCSRSLCGHRGWHQHMQLVAPVPDEGDRPDAFGQVQAEAQRLASPAHGQDEAVALSCDRLGGPLHRHVLFGFIRVAHAGVGRLELPGGLHVGQELVADHLNALRVQRELAALGGTLQRVTIRPGLMPQPSVLM